METTVDISIFRVRRSHPRKPGPLLHALRGYASEWAKIKEKEHLLEK